MTMGITSIALTIPHSHYESEETKALIAQIKSYCRKEKINLLSYHPKTFHAFCPEAKAKKKALMKCLAGSIARNCAFPIPGNYKAEIDIITSYLKRLRLQRFRCRRWRKAITVLANKSRRHACFLFPYCCIKKPGRSRS